MNKVEQSILNEIKENYVQGYKDLLRDIMNFNPKTDVPQNMPEYFPRYEDLDVHRADEIVRKYAKYYQSQEGRNEHDKRI